MREGDGMVQSIIGAVGSRAGGDNRKRAQSIGRAVQNPA